MCTDDLEARANSLENSRPEPKVWIALTFQKAVIVIFLASALAAVFAVVIEQRDTGAHAVKEIVAQVATPYALVLRPVLQPLGIPA